MPGAVYGGQGVGSGDSAGGQRCSVSIVSCARPTRFLSQPALLSRHQFPLAAGAGGAPGQYNRKQAAHAPAGAPASSGAGLLQAHAWAGAGACGAGQRRVCSARAAGGTHDMHWSCCAPCFPGRVASAPHSQSNHSLPATSYCRPPPLLPALQLPGGFEAERFAVQRRGTRAAVALAYTSMDRPVASLPDLLNVVVPPGATLDCLQARGMLA